MKALPFYYTEEYFKDERHFKKFYNKDGTPKVQSDKYINRIIDAEQFSTTRGKLLELGAARGGFLKVMKDRGWEVEGIEISQDAVDFGKEHLGLNLYCGILEDFKTTNSYDVVCMYQTLEHVSNPAYVIQRSFELLNQNGKLIIEVPNRHCFEMIYSQRRRTLSYDLPRHLSHFAPETIQKKLVATGFKQVHIFLHPDDHTTDFFAFLAKLKPSSKAAAASSSESTNNTGKSNTTMNLPMMKPSINAKTRLIDKITTLFPGWRFTIVGIK